MNREGETMNKDAPSRWGPILAIYGGLYLIAIVGQFPVGRVIEQWIVTAINRLIGFAAVGLFAVGAVMPIVMTVEAVRRTRRPDPPEAELVSRADVA